MEAVRHRGVSRYRTGTAVHLCVAVGGRRRADLQRGATPLVKMRQLIAEPGDVSAICSPRKDGACFTALFPFQCCCGCCVLIPYRHCSLCSSFRAFLLLLLLLLLHSWPSAAATSERAELSQLRAKSRTVTRSVAPAVVCSPALYIATAPCSRQPAAFPSLCLATIGSRN